MRFYDNNNELTKEFFENIIIFSLYNHNSKTIPYLMSFLTEQDEYFYRTVTTDKTANVIDEATAMASDFVHFCSDGENHIFIRNDIFPIINETIADLLENNQIQSIWDRKDEIVSALQIKVKITDVDIKDLIPSKTIRDYLETIHYALTDFQKATLIWNCIYYNHTEKLEYLLKLEKKTNDKLLKKQIMQRLCFENKSLINIRNNDDCVYISFGDDNGDFICYKEFKNALKNAKTNKYRIIEKHRLADYKGDITLRNHNEVNTYMSPGTITMPDSDNQFMGAVYLNDSYEISNVISYETTEQENAEVSSFDPKRFEYAYTPIPFPEEMLQAGLKVKNLINKKEGIIDTTVERWNEFLSTVNSGTYVDFSDYALVVGFYEKNGTSYHEHINPIFLEIVE